MLLRYFSFNCNLDDKSIAAFWFHYFPNSIQVEVFAFIVNIYLPNVSGTRATVSVSMITTSCFVVVIFESMNYALES